MILHAELLVKAPEVVQLRPEDAVACGMDGPAAVAWSIRESFRTYEVRVEDEPIAYWSYKPTSLLSSVCWAWMLTTPAASRFPMALARGSRRAVDYLLDQYPAVLCCVDPDHLVALRWLDWLGFVPDGSFGRFTRMIARRN